MPIDPNIILGVQPVKLQDPLESYGKALSLKALMGQQTLQDLQTKQAQQGVEDDQASREAYQQAGGDPTRVRALLAQKGQYKQVQALDKLLFEQRKGGSEITKNNAQAGTANSTQLVNATKLHRDDLANVNDPESAARWVQAGYQDPILGPVLTRGGTLEEALARVPKDPTQLMQWVHQNALGATKFIELDKPNIKQVDDGSTITEKAYPGLGGAPTVLGTTAKTATPGEVLSDATRRSEGAANRAVTVAGQNKVDARAREMNGIMEGQWPADLTPTIDAIGKHEIPLPNPPSGSRNPMAMVRYNELVKGVKEKYPDYNAQDYGSQAKAVKDFSSGKLGSTVRSFNTAIAHLDTLGGLSEALGNGNMQVFNKLGNAIATQTGKPAPVNFEAAKQIVADEITKAIVGGATALGDRAEAARNISAASSPAQLKGVIDTYKELMRGQLGGLKQQYETSTSRKDFDKLLTAGAKAEESGAVPAVAPSQQAIDAELRRRGVIK